MTNPRESTLPPHVQLIQMGTASWISALLRAAAELGIADHLASAPKSSEEIARATRMHPPSMHRFLRDHRFHIDRVDYPFFETRYFTAEMLLRLLDPSTTSPPFYGNFMTFYCTRT